MPSDPEIVKLKKQIHLLKEHISGLQQQNQEQLTTIGKLKTQILNQKNQTLMLQETQMNQTKNLRSNIETALLDEKEKTAKIEAENRELHALVAQLKQRNNENELIIKSLQLETNQVKKKLIEFTNKHDASDFVANIQIKEDALKKVEGDYGKLVADWNLLRDQMENVLCENRVLRQLADVPENFGLDISKIKLGDRQKIEDYKAKIRILKREVDELETERAQLKHKLTFLASAMENPEHPFPDLTPEQKVAVAAYAQELYEGKNLPDEPYDLRKQIQKLEAQLECFTNGEYSNIRIEGNYRINALKKQAQKPQPETETKRDDPEMKQLIKDIHEKVSTLQSGGVPLNTTVVQPQTYVDDYDNSLRELSFMQLPPMPQINEKNIDETKNAISYRYNSKFRIDPNNIYNIFGVAIDSEDPDKLKLESCALQSQLIELLEIQSRRLKTDEYLNQNINAIYNKFEGLLLIQNEVFERYMNDKQTYSKEVNELKKTNENLLAQIDNLSKINKSYELAIQTIKGDNASEIERQMIMKVKENAILETNLLKLKRKYDCLCEDERAIRSYVDNNDRATIEKDKQMQQVITQLKDWKKLLMTYLKFVYKKLQHSVDKDEFDKVIEENKYLREVNNELTNNDLELVKQSSIAQAMKLKYRDLENEYYDCQEMKLDAQIELNALKNKIAKLDPNYYLEQKAFRKLAMKFIEKQMTYEDIIKQFTTVSIANANVGGVATNINDDIVNVSQTNMNMNMNTTINNDMYKYTQHKQMSTALMLLTMDNSNIPKTQFEEMLIKRLDGFYGESTVSTTNNITNTDLQLIYKYLNCEDESTLDLRTLIKKLEQTAIDEHNVVEKENQLWQQFIDCVKASGRSLLETFEYFDTNNNGNITREEFKYALQQLRFPVNDEVIAKIIFLVSGEPESTRKLDHTDTFNYIEFCDLFEQRSKNYMLQLKKHKTNKNIFSIDKKTNLLTTICLALNDAHIDIKQCLKGFDMTSPGYITKNEFLLFVKSQTAVLTDNDIEFLYNTYDDGARGAVSKDVIVASLETTQQQVDAYTNLAHHQYSGTLSQFDMQNQYYRLLEERKHFEFRLAQMRARLSELEKANDAVNKELTLRSEEHKKTVDKYFKAMTENTQIKSEYVTNGVTKADLISLEENNDALVREVTLLRIGLNTFKELYNSSNTQIKQLQLYKVKINDELDTYKRALKELQGETNANALIGKLYYTILLSRWREANTLRRYDEFVNEFAMMKEENFQLDTQSRNLVKDFTQLQVEFHKITIENVRMSDQIENYENGIVVYSSTDKSQSHPIEALKLLTKELSKDRDELTSQVITLKKQLMKVDIEKEELKNQIAFCMTIADKIRFDNQDQYSKKLIALCDEVAKLKLATNVCKRENTFLSENEKHLSHIIEQLTTNVKTLEVDNAEWESKFRTMEEIYRVKDNERQTKLFTALSKLSIYDVNELQLKLNSKDSATSSSVSNTKTITTGNNGVKKVIAPVSNNPKDKIIFAEYETQLKTLQHALSLKDDEIRRLTMINNENMKLLQQNKTMFNNNNNNSIANLVGQSGYDVIKDDETKLVAKTAHKTIKTLQDMLTQKNTLLKKKEENIEELRKENYEIKQNYTARIHVLEDKLKNDHQQTMKKLSNVIDSSNANLIVKKTKNELSLLNMNDLEKLIDDKDNTIKALAIELHATKEQRDNALALLEGKNKQIIEMNSNNAMNNSINSRQSKKMTTSVRSVKKK